MTATSSLPFPPPLSSTIRNPKPPPIAAPTGHIAFIHRRGSSLFQRFAVKKPQHKHQPTDIKSPVHAPSPPALCNKHTAPVGSCAASYRGFGQQRRRRVVNYADLPPLGRFWWCQPPLHIFYVLIDTTKTNIHTTTLKE